MFGECGLVIVYGELDGLAPPGNVGANAAEKQTAPLKAGAVSSFSFAQA